MSANSRPYASMCSCHLAAAGPPGPGPGPPGPPLGARGVGEAPRAEVLRHHGRGLQCRRDATEEPQAPVIHMSDEGGPTQDAITFRTSAGPNSQSSQTFGSVEQGGRRSFGWACKQPGQIGRTNVPFSDGKHNVYGPDTLEVMCAAYDTAVQLLPSNLQDHERARRRLALLILRHMDRGESERDIVNLALLDLLRLTQ